MAKSVQKVDSKRVLSYLRIGFWTIDYPADGAPPRLYGDTMLYQIMGVQAEMSAEELYDYWFSRIEPTYVQSVVDSIQYLKEDPEHAKIEVRYPWRHPTRGWTFIRCGAYIDTECLNGLRLKGFHKDVSDQTEFEHHENSAYRIADLRKLKIYSTFVLELCQSLYEIDPESLITLPVYFRESDQVLENDVNTGLPFSEICNRVVHPEDRETLMSLISGKNLKMITGTTKNLIVEFRRLSKSREWVWFEGKLRYVKVGSLEKLLFMMYEIQDRKKLEKLQRENTNILDAFVNICSAVMEVNLSTEQVRLLKISKEASLTNSHGNLAEPYPLEAMIYRVSKKINSDYDCRKVKDFFDINNLRRLTKLKIPSEQDFRILNAEGKTEWFSVQTLYMIDDDNKLYIVFKNADKEHLLTSIAENFVFENCDFVYLIDINNDTFQCYINQYNNSIYPPAKGCDYRKQSAEFLKKFVVPEDLDWVLAKMNPEYIIEHLNREGEYSITFGITEKDSQYKRKQIDFRYYDCENKVVILRGYDITDVYSKQKAQENQLKLVRRAAEVDYLTGIYNRRAGIQAIEQALSYSGKLGAMFIIDLDDFKKINDTYGHIIGDAVLRTVGKALKTNLRANDIVMRLGGDEFVVFLSNIRSREQAEHCAMKLIATLANYNKTELYDFTASIGIAMVSEKSEDFSSLYQIADRALYIAKAMGKNKFSFVN